MKYKSTHSLLALFIAMALCILAVSCGSSDDDFSESFTFDVREQSTIESDKTSRQVASDSSVIVYNFSIQPGDSVVFKYQRDVDPPDNITDAGLIETLVFQIPANVTSFELRDEELPGARTFYRRGCFCPLSGAGFKVDNGLVQGEMLSANIWFVQADLTVDAINQSFDVQFKGVFRLP